jgi:serine/threonine protein phosphatase 1
MASSPHKKEIWPLEHFDVPAGQRFYAIGDVHGYADTLHHLFQQIEADMAKYPDQQSTVILLGDYIDRGPQSAQVIEQLIQRQKAEKPYKLVCLAGNHDLAMPRFIDNCFGSYSDWLHFGGLEALQSYAVDEPSLPEQPEDIAKWMKNHIPAPHFDFIESLNLYYQEGELLFVHAGLMPGIPLKDQIEQDLVYTREPFLSHTDLHPFYVIHGHTICRNHQVDFQPNRLNIDTGLYDGGLLTCAVVAKEGISFLQSQTRY